MSYTTSVNITTQNGKTLEFSRVLINQQFNQHHFFEINLINLISDQYSHFKSIDDTKDLLGKIINISIKSEGDGKPENIFKGIVTEIGLENNSDNYGETVIKGYSPTILLEGGKHIASFSAVTLADIVHKTVSGVASNLLSTKVSPAYSKAIPYTVQYNESNFEFLRRLAAHYGEYFFYDGTSLCFGKPSSGDTYQLNYPIEVSAFNFHLNLNPLKFEMVEHYSEKGDKFSSESDTSDVAGLNSYGTFAVKTSNNLFPNNSRSFSHVKSEEKSDLDGVAKFKVSSAASGLVQITASSDFCYLKPAVNVNISAQSGISQTNEDFGKYMVMHVTHIIDRIGNYSNSFDAIGADVKVVPNNYTEVPAAEPQLGVITDNKDPDNLGRVQVRLLWQEQGQSTPWLRVLSLHSGGTNRGLFFIPEVGDYVIVGFTQNDPDRPFVMGSVPNGKSVDSSKNNDNNIKSIRTRTGNTIYLRDKEQDKIQEIVVKTDDNNIISISVDSGKGTIKIASSKDINISSDSSISIKSKDITIEASNQLEMKAQTIKISAQQQLAMEGQQQLSAKGMQVSIEGTTTTAIKSSAQLTIQGGALASIKAPLVQIN